VLSLRKALAFAAGATAVNGLMMKAQPASGTANQAGDACCCQTINKKPWVILDLEDKGGETASEKDIKEAYNLKLSQVGQEHRVDLEWHHWFRINEIGICQNEPDVSEKIKALEEINYAKDRMLKAFSRWRNTCGFITACGMLVIATIILVRHLVRGRWQKMNESADDILCVVMVLICVVLEVFDNHQHPSLSKTRNLPFWVRYVFHFLWEVAIYRVVFFFIVNCMLIGSFTLVNAIGSFNGKESCLKEIENFFDNWHLLDALPLSISVSFMWANKVMNVRAYSVGGVFDDERFRFFRKILACVLNGWISVSMSPVFVVICIFDCVITLFL